MNILKVLDDYNINVSKLKNLIHITDGGINLIKAAELIEGTHVYCFNHMLHNCILESLKIDKFKVLVKKYKKIVRFFKKSCIFSSALEDLQGNNKRKLKKRDGIVYF